MSKSLLGKIDSSRVKQIELEPFPEALLAGFRELEDATGLISDTLDVLGIPGAIGASVLRPTVTGANVVGRALTLRNIAQDGNFHEKAQTGHVGMAEIEAHNLATQGDVLVVQGVSGTSNMGGISAQIGKRQGELAAIVDGGVRDVAHSRRVGYPVWATELTPLTGKWRIETVEINGTVQVCGVRVNAGDLVVADDTGVCFIPKERAQEVLELVQLRAKKEEIRCNAIDQGIAIKDLPKPA
ncbi:RraA family protein [Advenella kashmirensis]